MPSGPEPLTVDPGDFDAIGILGEVIAALRVHSIEADTTTAATISAPDGWHRVVISALASGHVVVGVRYVELSTSRRHNVADALARRGWQADEDEGGTTTRFPPGTEPADAAFEVLAALTISGAPSTIRTVIAIDGRGDPVALA